jgi:hypothetical protein
MPLDCLAEIKPRLREIEAATQIFLFMSEQQPPREWLDFLKENYPKVYEEWQELRKTLSELERIGKPEIIVTKLDHPSVNLECASDPALDQASEHQAAPDHLHTSIH